MPMPALLMATMLIAAGQDVSTLRVPPPPAFTESEPWPGGPRFPDWSHALRADRAVSCSKPADGQLVTYDLLPTEVLADLRRTDPRMSPPGGPFSATDAWDGTSPFTRMIAAMRRGDRLVVAYERGGRGYSVTVLTYDRDASTGLMAISGVHPLLPGKAAHGWNNGDAACEALAWALGT
jgi:hypothetical protein